MSRVSIAEFVFMHGTEAVVTMASRRDLLAASLLGALPMLPSQPRAASATARPNDPEQTLFRAPDALRWTSPQGYPERSVDRCQLTGDSAGSGLYYNLVRWWPGYMSAPHAYITDAFCFVVSGTWWCNSRPDFDPATCVPVKTGSYVRRVAGVPQYDGVIRGGTEPAVIAICGIAPVDYKLVDPSKPGWRRV